MDDATIVYLRAALLRGILPEQVLGHAYAVRLRRRGKKEKKTRRLPRSSWVDRRFIHHTQLLAQATLTAGDQPARRGEKKKKGGNPLYQPCQGEKRGKAERAPAVQKGEGKPSQTSIVARIDFQPRVTGGKKGRGPVRGPLFSPSTSSGEEKKGKDDGGKGALLSEDHCKRRRKVIPCVQSLPSGERGGEKHA